MEESARGTSGGSGSSWGTGEVEAALSLLAGVAIGFAIAATQVEVFKTTMAAVALAVGILCLLASWARFTHVEQHDDYPR